MSFLEILVISGLLLAVECVVSNYLYLGPELLSWILVSHPSPSVLIPALRTVGNIVTGDDMQTQVLTTSKTSENILVSCMESIYS